MGKMDKKWIVLCSTAVAAIYATGYFSTEDQAKKLDMQQTAQVSVQNNKSHPNVVTSHPIQSKAAQSNTASINQTQTRKAAASVQTAVRTQPKQKYKDGTFTGTGMNRRGSIQVAVTMQKDRITDVVISDWGMHYAQSDVVGLPSEVLRKQNAQVNNVSGATYSTQAFEDAVQNALSRAQNA